MRSSVPERLRLVALAAFLTACPELAKPEAGTCGFGEVLVSEPSALPAEGDVRIGLVRAPPTEDGATLALVVEQSDGGRELGAKTLTREASWLVPLGPGEVNLRLTLSCPNAPPSTFDSKLQVYPRVELTETLPRVCEVLAPAGRDAFECDGVVVGRSGEELAGRPRGTSRTFWADGGWGRWVHTDAGLQLETTRGTTPPLPVAPSAQMVVTEQFAFMEGQVIRIVDGGLVASSIDAAEALEGRADLVPCAAAFVEGREWVAWCVDPSMVFFDPPRGDEPFVVCELVGSSTRCSWARGVFVGQDVRSHEVVLRQPDQFIRFELSQQTPSSSRSVRPGEETFRAPTAHTGDGRQGVMYRGGGVYGFLLPGASLEPFVVSGSGVRASSELVWDSDEDAGLTRFSWLRQP